MPNVEKALFIDPQKIKIILMFLFRVKTGAESWHFLGALTQRSKGQDRGGRCSENPKIHRFVAGPLAKMYNKANGS